MAAVAGPVVCIFDLQNFLVKSLNYNNFFSFKLGNRLLVRGKAVPMQETLRQLR